ncbi:S8 family serine peptidase [Micromonospora sp. NPDC048063]|uniref:S8 family serine peptidase n=1 Tax=Micromonospora sp. NPDC048063 TaxID=3364256 RepID=UPI0037237081
MRTIPVSPRPPWPRRLTAVLAVGVLAGSLAGPASASPPESAGPQQSAKLVDSHQLTLVTGERIQLDQYSDGTSAGTVVPNADGTQPDILTVKLGEDLYAIPTEAGPYIAAGRLDRELFNLTKLVSYGYDDERRAAIPLIATYNTPAAADDASTPAGSVRQAKLSSIDGLALSASKKHARTFWEAVDDDNAKTAAVRPVLADGITKLWLDKPVKVALDRSVPQIGAPEAWAKGYDGKGVKVAVLDTGIDPNHPDLVDRIKATKNFTGDPDPVDHHGHGTHVASTIAGSGAASSGKYKGVAPAADLYIGKVLSNQGEGSESGIISGMQWAVAQGADIVSMSLGSTAAGDGTDPMSQAVNDLSASNDTLFVIAAGNAGPGSTTVGSPGAADAALTVGAVDKSDVLAPFSSRGPRAADFAVKPEITAPGVGIVAARAAGTTMGTPVDGSYTSANGTSMATPHVAGAAAILKQRHPDWTYDHLKQVLVGTAKPGPFTAFQQGNGRVDVPKTLDATLYSNPATVSAGAIDGNSAPVLRKITYVNTAGTSRTLKLTLTATGPTGSAAPAGVFTLAADTVTVPAVGTAETTVTVTPSTGLDGAYTARVTATADTGEVTRTTIGALIQPPGYDLTINATDRKGNPASVGNSVYVYNTDNGFFRDVPLNSGITTLRVPVGRYFVMGLVGTANAGGRAEDLTLAGDPQLEVNGPTTVTLDARQGKEIKVRTPRNTEAHGFRLGFTYIPPFGPGLQVMLGMSGPFYQHAYVVPTEKVTRGSFDLNFRTRRYAPIIRSSYADGTPLPLMPGAFTANFDGHTKMQAVDAGPATPAALEGVDLTGKLAVIQRTTGVQMLDQVKAVAAKGAAVAVMVNGTPGAFTPPFPPGTTPIPTYGLGADTGKVLTDTIARGTTTLDLRGIANSPYVYNVSYRHSGGLPENPQVNVTRNNSAVYKSTFPAAKDKTVIGDTQPMWLWYDSVSLDVVDWFSAPHQREEWYSAGDAPGALAGVRWVHNYFPDVTKISRSLNDGLRVHTPGEVASSTWLAPANGPAGPQVAEAYRQGDEFKLYIPEIGDSDPSHLGRFDTPGDTSLVRVYRNGELINEQRRFLRATVPVSADPGTYRITMDTSHANWYPLSTSTRTAWTFDSTRPAGGSATLPLLWPRYDFATDEHNTQLGGVTGHFRLTVVPQTGASVGAVKTVEVRASYDDGATWHDTTVHPQGDGFHVGVRNPGSGFVSLRIKAQDDRGNAVEQTLIRAYAVR